MILEGTKDPIMIYSNNNYLYTIDNTIMLWFSGFNRKIGNYEYNLYDISDNTLVYFNKSKLYIIDFLNNKNLTKSYLIENNLTNLIIIDESIYYVKYLNERYTVFEVCKNKLSKKIIFSSKRRIKLGKNNHYLHIIKSSYNEHIIIYDTETKTMETFSNRTNYFIGYWNGFIEHDFFNERTDICINKNKILIDGLVRNYVIRKDKILLNVSKKNKLFKLIEIDMNTLEQNCLLISKVYIKEVRLTNGYLMINYNDLVYDIDIWFIEKYENKIKCYYENKKIIPQKKYQRKFTQKDNIPYDVYKNLETSKDKTLIYLHGGPHVYIDRSNDFLKRFLMGFCDKLIVIHYVGSKGFGKKYETSLYGNWGKIEVESILQVIQSENIDFSKTVLFGESYGATISILLATKYELSFKKILAVSGPIDVKEYYYKLTNYQKLIYLKRCSYSKNKIIDRDTYFEEISPVTYFQNKTTPINIIYGEKDYRIGLDSLKKYTNKFENINISEIKNAAHDLQSIFNNIKLCEINKFL